VSCNTIIGHRFFTDGSMRPVYRDDQGQYILDDAGCPVYGHWLLSEDDGPDFADWNDAPLITGGGGE
jgi:hypothetical protein